MVNLSEDQSRVVLRSFQEDWERNRGELDQSKREIAHLIFEAHPEWKTSLYRKCFWLYLEREDQ